MAFAAVVCARNIGCSGIVTVKNISMGGLSFISDVIFYLGDKVIIDLGLNMAGVIQRVSLDNNTYQYGVKFEEISDYKKGDLCKLISKL